MTMQGGTYTLVLEVAEAIEIEIGALGTRPIPAGAYAYTGSALGPGGFARVDRHERLASGEHDARHWHVDYLLGHPACTMTDHVRSSAVDAECAIARRLGPGPIEGFGASDCACHSHLAHETDLDRLVERVRSVHAAER